MKKHSVFLSTTVMLFEVFMHVLYQVKKKSPFIPLTFRVLLWLSLLTGPVVILILTDSFKQLHLLKFTTALNQGHSSLGYSHLGQRHDRASFCPVQYFSTEQYVPKNSPWALHFLKSMLWSKGLPIYCPIVFYPFKWIMPAFFLLMQHYLPSVKFQANRFLQASCVSAGKEA